MFQDTPSSIFERAQNTQLQINASTLLPFLQIGEDREGQPLYHSDRLTAFGLYMLMLVEYADENGRLPYEDGYFEDVAAHYADLTCDMDVVQVLMYFSHLIDGGLLKMRPDGLRLTIAESAVDQGDEVTEQAKRVTKSAEPAGARNAEILKNSTSIFAGIANDDVKFTDDEEEDEDAADVAEAEDFVPTSA